MTEKAKDVLCGLEPGQMAKRMNIEQRIAEELGCKKSQVEKTIELIDEGNTIPFIARYRKEVTGSLTDEQLRVLEHRLTSLRNLAEKKEEVVRKIDEQGKLTPELVEAVAAAETTKEVDDIYLPYRPKRRTRASDARERGLEPLAKAILAGEADGVSVEELTAPYLNEQVPDAEAAIAGARDIIAEEMAENAESRSLLRRNLNNSGTLVTELSADAEDENAQTYRMYFDSSEPVSEMPAHRILAINRAEKEGVLRVHIATTDDRNRFRLLRVITRDSALRPGGASYSMVEEAVDDGYKRLLYPSIEKEVRQEMTERADEVSIKIFADNLRPYLMQPPLKQTVVMGLDPGYRTGCKVAVIDENGAVLDHATIYPTVPKNDVAGSRRVMERFIKKYGVSLIAIGNGTASRETEQVVAEMIRESGNPNLFYAIVNESGASIYSASQLGTEEFPDLDVTIRGAISIARRIQDPLAELVKIEPKHIGVGQYQHDVDQKALESALEDVVESCVNAVGVNVNTASPSLLGYVSGISKTVAKNIVAHKEANGAFRSREELKKVKGLGPKTFVQCAGFLRIPEGSEPLDNTAVHPESYEIARAIVNEDLGALDYAKWAEKLGVGEPTLRDIVEELQKPGRDPRDEMPKPVLRSDVLSVDDLEEGMELRGTVRNVVAFGCFVDIGVKQDGLVHISQLGERYYDDPSKIVSVSDIVTVKILSIDRKRGRIGLTMKGIKQEEEIEKRKKLAGKSARRGKR